MPNKDVSIYCLRRKSDHTKLTAFGDMCLSLTVAPSWEAYHTFSPFAWTHDDKLSVPEPWIAKCGRIYPVDVEVDSMREFIPEQITAFEMMGYKPTSAWVFRYQPFLKDGENLSKIICKYTYVEGDWTDSPIFVGYAIVAERTAGGEGRTMIVMPDARIGYNPYFIPKVRKDYSFDPRDERNQWTARVVNTDDAFSAINQEFKVRLEYEGTEVFYDELTTRYNLNCFYGDSRIMDDGVHLSDRIYIPVVYLRKSFLKEGRRARMYGKMAIPQCVPVRTCDYSPKDGIRWRVAMPTSFEYYSSVFTHVSYLNNDPPREWMSGAGRKLQEHDPEDIGWVSTEFKQLREAKEYAHAMLLMNLPRLGKQLEERLGND